MSKMKLMPFIMGLCRPCRPANVSWPVMAVRVNAVECMGHIRTFSKFFKEVLKRLKAKFNPSGSIVFVRLSFGIIATSLRGHVAAIRKADRISNGLPVREKPFSRFFFAQTAARQALAGTEGLA